MKLPSFLITLFEYNWFAPALFATIAVLTIIFFIVLFFGKKDEKERELQDTKKLELASLNSFDSSFAEPNEEKAKENIYANPFADLNNNITNEEPSLGANAFVNEEIAPNADGPIMVGAAESVLPILEPTKEEDFVLPQTPIEEPVVNNSFISGAETPVEPPRTDVNFDSLLSDIDAKIKQLEESEQNAPAIEQEVVQPVVSEPEKNPNYDFDSLAQSINKELEELEKMTKNNAEPAEVSFPEIPVEEPKVSAPASKPKEIFSSVFIQPEKEMPSEYSNDSFMNNFNALLGDSKEKAEEDVKFELPKVSEESEAPVKPKFELPKKNADIPKLNEEDKSNIITPADFPEFPNLTDNGYSFKK